MSAALTFSHAALRSPASGGARAAQVQTSVSRPPIHKASEVSLRQSSGVQGHRREKTPGVVGERIVDFLRGLYDRKTAESVAADLQGLGRKVSASTVAKWLERTSVPSGETMLDLFRLYRFAFLHAVMPEDDAVAEAARQEKRVRLLREQAALEAEIAALVIGEDAP